MNECVDWITRRIRDGSVLDIGCGNGVVALAAAVRGGVTSVEGVDPAQAKVDRARRNWARLDLDQFVNVHFAMCDMASLRYGAENFDTVLITDALEMARDTAGVLNEATRVLKHGGMLLMSVPSDDRVVGERVRTFTLASALELLAAHGLRVDEFARFHRCLCFCCVRT